MSEMTLTRGDRKELEALVARRFDILDTLGRRKLLADAGVEEVAGSLSWGASPDLFAWQLVRKLQDRGTLSSTGQPALVSLVRELRAVVKGQEDEAAFLDRLLEPYDEAGAEPVAPVGDLPVLPVDRATVLFMAANPRKTAQLRLGEEVKRIKKRLREAALRDRFEIEQEHAVEWPDVSQHLMDYMPHVVHFAGHGSQGGELVFQDSAGQPWPVPVRDLGETFRILRDNIHCVVLNACWSKEQADAIVEHIDVVVGMTRPVPDDAAIRFSAGFYRGLGHGRSVQDAFDLGKVEMSVKPPRGTGDDRDVLPGGTPAAGRDPGPLADIPELLRRPGVDPASCVLVRARASD